MERDFGLYDLSRNERDIILAFCELTRDDPTREQECTTEKVRTSPIVRDISRPTFHRALKQLIERGMIERGEDVRMGVYRLTPKTIRGV
jgi:predicted transcriptional regulator